MEMPKPQKVTARYRAELHGVDPESVTGPADLIGRKVTGLGGGDARVVDAQDPAPGTGTYDVLLEQDCVVHGLKTGKPE